MRISITDFLASSPPKKWGVDTFPCCMLPGMGAPPFEQDFRKHFLGITGSTEQSEGKKASVSE